VELGYSGAPAAYGAVMAGLKDEIREPAIDVLNLELGRLNTWQEIINTQLDVAIEIHDFDSVIKCVVTNLKIQERRSKYLGLDTAARAESLYEEIQRLSEKTGLDPQQIVKTAEEIIRG
jgi:hypothetical protein